jgi:hypothetical protein
MSIISLWSKGSIKGCRICDGQRGRVRVHTLAHNFSFVFPDKNDIFQTVKIIFISFPEALTL